MEYDTDKIDEVVHALLSLGLHDVDQFGGRVWKGFDWEAMNRLHAKGLIDDPQSKAKSVFLTRDQIDASRMAFDRLFGKRDPASKADHHRQTSRRGIGWHDLIKTCNKIRATDILLKPGAVPMIRVRDQWRHCDADPIEIPDLHRYIDEHLRPHRVSKGDPAEFEFSDDQGATFRTYAFGYPSTTMLLISRRPIPSPPEIDKVESPA